MQNQKRIVIIEGDAFDADAIVAIRKSTSLMVVVHCHGKDEGVVYKFADEATRNHAFALAVDAWRAAVGDAPSNQFPPSGAGTDEPFPDQPTPPVEPEESVIEFWRDTIGRYYTTYGGQTVYLGSKTGNFIWNEGPPRRKNPLGPGASPIEKVYVDEAGKPLDPQPI